MNAVTFDTLKAARRLREEHGFDERRASGVVETFADGMQVNFDHLATKSDIALLKADIDAVGSEMRELEQRMTVKLGAMIVAAGGFFTLLHRLL